MDGQGTLRLDAPVGKWHFPVRQQGERYSNEGVQSAFKGMHPAFALVGELAQNTRDAKRQPGPCPELRLSLRQVAWESLERLGFPALKLHVESSKLPDITGATLVPGVPVALLLCEDNGTGLTGEIEDIGTPTSNAQKYLYEVGSGASRAAKRGNQNGRHGVGAEMATIASTQRTAYFHSTREDGSSLASGRSSLTGHSLGCVEYLALGSYCTDRTHGFGPCTGPASDAVHREIGFLRPAGDPGMSVAILDPVRDFTFRSLFMACVASQFYQVKSGHIRIVVDGGPGHPVIDLNRETIRDLVRQPEFLDALSASRDLIKRKEFAVLDRISEVLDFLQRDEGIKAVGGAELDGKNMLFLGNDRDVMRVALADRRPAKFDMILAMRNKPSRSCAETVEMGVATVTIQAFATSGRLDILVRDSIVIVENRDGPGRFSITKASGDKLAECLGDCEDPSHRKFLPSYGRDRGWPDASATIGAFQGAVDRAMKALDDTGEDTDTSSLASFFPLLGEERLRMQKIGIPGGSGGQGFLPTDDGDSGDDGPDMPSQRGPGNFVIMREFPDTMDTSILVRITPAAFGDDPDNKDVRIKVDYATGWQGRTGVRWSSSRVPESHGMRHPQRIRRQFGRGVP